MNKRDIGKWILVLLGLIAIYQWLKGPINTFNTIIFAVNLILLWVLFEVAYSMGRKDKDAKSS